MQSPLRFKWHLELWYILSYPVNKKKAYWTFTLQFDGCDSLMSHKMLSLKIFLPVVNEIIRNGSEKVLGHQHSQKDKTKWSHKPIGEIQLHISAQHHHNLPFTMCS
jgi:hypothetical protein